MKLRYYFLHLLLSIITITTSHAMEQTTKKEKGKAKAATTAFECLSHLEIHERLKMLQINASIIFLSVELHNQLVRFLKLKNDIFELRNDLENVGQDNPSVDPETDLLPDAVAIILNKMLKPCFKATDNQEDQFKIIQPYLKDANQQVSKSAKTTMSILKQKEAAIVNDSNWLTSPIAPQKTLVLATNSFNFFWTFALSKVVPFSP